MIQTSNALKLQMPRSSCGRAWFPPHLNGARMRSLLTNARLEKKDVQTKSSKWKELGSMRSARLEKRDKTKHEIEYLRYLRHKLVSLKCWCTVDCSATLQISGDDNFF